MKLWAILLAIWLLLWGLIILIPAVAVPAWCMALLAIGAGLCLLLGR